MEEDEKYYCKTQHHRLITNNSESTDTLSIIVRPAAATIIPQFINVPRWQMEMPKKAQCSLEVHFHLPASHKSMRPLPAIM